jgi:tripartite-type tricarboxylate transporter receptor subunit TctC
MNPSNRPARLLRRRSLLAAAAAWPAASLLCTRAVAQTAAAGWPNRPVRFIVPAPAGSSLDIVARLLGEKLQPKWNQPVVVENRPGAGGMLGVDLAVRATDGHTFAIGFNGPLAFAQHLYKKVPYDVRTEVAPIAMTSIQPNVLVVNPQLPVKTMRELVAHIRANPAKLNFASVGNGSSSHLSMELIKARLGLAMQHVPYNGAPPAALSVIAGDTHMLFAVASGVLPQVKAGKLRMIAVTSPKRFDWLPDVPAIAESGIKELRDFEALAWNGVVGPAATPPAVVKKLNADINAVLDDTEIKARFWAQGTQTAPTTPEGFKRVIESDSLKWGEVIRTVGIKLD